MAVIELDNGSIKYQAKKFMWVVGDAKPTNCDAGSLGIEYDDSTNAVVANYIYNGAKWIKL